VLIAAFVGLAIFVAATGMVGASAVLLALSVAGTGFCLVGANNTLNAYATTLYPTEIRSTAVGWGGSFGRFVSGFAPIIGGILLHELPLQTVFFIFALPAVSGAFAVAAMSWTRPARQRASSSPAKAHA